MLQRQRIGAKRYRPGATLPAVLLTISMACAFALAQDTATPPAGGDDAWSRPTQEGIRLTPDMARGISRQFVNHVLKSRYEIPEERHQEAEEAIARSLMKTAHAHQEQGRDVAEFYMEQVFNMMADWQQGKSGMGGIPQRFGMGFGERVLPMMPAVRDLIKEVGQELRPMLPFKQQLKFGADLMTLHKGVDAFEETMKRWSEGHVNPYENPFQSDDEQVTLDENGQSEALKRASERAAKGLEIEEFTNRWKRYVEQARQLYGFDETQNATADSILSEITQRAETAGQDEQLQARAYRNRLWAHMIHVLPMGWGNPVRQMIDRNRHALREPFEELGKELRERIDSIPRQLQREQADAHISEMLAVYELNKAITGDEEVSE